ncbi:TIGR03086 family metal-binding protein [Actinomadura fulvescens]|uniref:Mycothiol-dependent maleylpyruvate isomerase metal-binding domain-containing protein n=1 Tax=Actinomadura fulvescens TaxID=46160 RepID=A0ABN3Q8N8_9ACTN
MSDTTPWAVLNEAHEILRTAVRGVPADAWTRPTPCTEWNVTQVLQHAAGDQLGYAAFITGGPGPEDNPFAPSGTLSGDPETILDDALRASAAAWSTVAPGTREVPVPIPPNKLTAEIGVAACALDAAVHGWDIAVATGRPSPLTPALARALMPAAEATVTDPIRQYGMYAAPHEAEEGDDEVAALLRFLGRRPGWTPA